jgi:hypothetical protein
MSGKVCLQIGKEILFKILRLRHDGMSEVNEYEVGAGMESRSVQGSVPHDV